MALSVNFGSESENEIITTSKHKAAQAVDGQSTFEAGEPVCARVVVPEQVHRVRDVLLGVLQQRAVEQLRLQPVHLQVVNLKTAVLRCNLVFTIYNEVILLMRLTLLSLEWVGN